MAASIEENGPSAAAAAEIKRDVEEVEEEEEEVEEDDPEEEEEEEEEEEGEEDESVEKEKSEGDEEKKKWPGWPGYTAYRLIVPSTKVGGLIGRKGELIKKLTEETRAKVRVLDGLNDITSDRVVLIFGKEEPDSDLSPAMNAVLQVFKRVNGITEGEHDTVNGPPVCSVRLVVPSTQAISLIGKQGALIKSIQESSSAQVRVLSGVDLPIYVTSDERVVDIQGDPSKVLKALIAVVGYLRKFLVDQSIFPLFQEQLNETVSQERNADSAHSIAYNTKQTSIGDDYPHSLGVNRDSVFDREEPLDSRLARNVSLYGQDPALSVLRSSGLGRGMGALVTKITQTMQIPLSYAEDIIGVAGATIAHIRSASGAFLSVQETVGVPDEITVEIKGTSSQVQLAQQLIQDAIAGAKETPVGPYGGLDSRYRSSYSSLANSGYPSSSFSSQSYGGGYGSSGLGGGYRSYRY